MARVLIADPMHEAAVRNFEARGIDARSEINAHLLTATTAAGYETRITDETLLILEFIRPNL